MWRAFQAFITLERDYYFIHDNSHQNIPPSLEKSKFTQRAWGNTEPTELSVPGLRSQSRNTKNSMFSGQTTKFENVSCWQIKPLKTRFFFLCQILMIPLSFNQHFPLSLSKLCVENRKKKTKLKFSLTLIWFIHPLPSFSLSKLLAGSLIEINRALKSMKDN